MARPRSPNEMRPCERCGRRRHVASKRKYNICADCRAADPEYVRMTEGAAA